MQWVIVEPAPAGSPAMSFLFNAGRQRRGVCDPGRLATREADSNGNFRLS